MASFAQMTFDPITANYIAHGQIYGELLKQAHLWGYVDTFRWFAISTFLLIPMLIFVKKPKNETKPISE